MKRLSTAALAVALMTGASGIALAAGDAASTQSPSTKAETSAPAKPATPAASEKMGTPTAQASMPAESSKKAEAVKKAKPMHHTAMAHRYYRDTEGDRETRALNILEANGYVDITSFRPEAKDYVATVKQHGKEIQVRVDPDSHRVQPLA